MMTADRDSSTSPTADECVQAGMYWFGACDYEAARAWWERAVELDPGHRRAAECLSLLEQTVGSKPRDPAPSSSPSPGATGPIVERVSSAPRYDAWQTAAPNRRPAVLRAGKDPWGDGAEVDARGLADGESPALDELIIEAPLEDEPVEEQVLDPFAEAEQCLRLHDFEGALGWLETVLDTSSDSTERSRAARMAERCRASLKLMLTTKLGSLEAKPAVAMTSDEIVWLNLSPRAGFVLSQIDGCVTVDDILALAGIPDIDTLQILVSLKTQGVIRLT